MYAHIFERIEELLLDAPLVQNERWQSVKAPQPSYEILNHHVMFPMPTEDLDFYRKAIEPNLPWADQHFELERVSGEPFNPGTTWRQWPYAKSADTHRREGEKDPQFDHTYAERYWPKWAGQAEGGQIAPLWAWAGNNKINQGIRFPYGDLFDLVNCLAKEPNTRQAYLPVWFPEDLAASVAQKRVPCSLGYHFIQRRGFLHINYYIRSCDYVRHFRDDVYLTVRLLLWVLDQCRRQEERDYWPKVKPGVFNMYITSLHVFEGDLKVLKACRTVGEP